MKTRCVRPAAVAKLRGDGEHPDLRGTVKFIPQCGGVLVIAEVSGLPESEAGFFALHIHEGGDCCGRGFPNTGGHYNPDNRPHPRHAGDLPPLLSCGGSAYLAVQTNRFRAEDIVGMTVVIHDKPDDFRSQPSGNAGGKIACGVIYRA